MNTDSLYSAVMFRQEHIFKGFVFDFKDKKAQTKSRIEFPKVSQIYQVWSHKNKQKLLTCNKFIFVHFQHAMQTDKQHCNTMKAKIVQMILCLQGTTW